MAIEKLVNGKRYVSFCALNSFALLSTVFKHIRFLPNCQYLNLIEHVAVMGADCVSDYNLVITKTLLKLNKTGRVASTLGKMFLCLT